MTTAIPITRTTHSRLTQDLREKSPFGTNYSDHMFAADYADGQWHDARIVPFGPMSFSPALTAFHYGQALFEGSRPIALPTAVSPSFDPWRIMRA